MSTLSRKLYQLPLSCLKLACGGMPASKADCCTSPDAYAIAWQRNGTKRHFDQTTTGMLISHTQYQHVSSLMRGSNTCCAMVAGTFAARFNQPLSSRNTVWNAALKAAAVGGNAVSTGDLPVGMASAWSPINIEG